MGVHEGCADRLFRVFGVILWSLSGLYGCQACAERAYASRLACWCKRNDRVKLFLHLTKRLGTVWGEFAQCGGRWTVDPSYNSPLLRRASAARAPSTSSFYDVTDHIAALTTGDLL